ncbi:MAG: hypothetical protein HYR88_18180 [Verrucomicrobia bacterium]|nr:hypothetical protein [Verrucomicrobiota bacterium]MBI3869237.1 hypothetical protein [Verrucomicrobiota bacterium]
MGPLVGLAPARTELKGRWPELLAFADMNQMDASEDEDAKSLLAGSR